MKRKKIKEKDKMNSFYYTGRGDNGFTDLYFQRVSKGDPIVNVVGKIDELLAFIGHANSKIKDEEIKNTLRQVEHHLYLINAKLSGYLEKTDKTKEFNDEIVKFLEEKIDYFGNKIQFVPKFVSPEGSEASTMLNICRTKAREAEREFVKGGLNDQTILKYLNRLSTLFYVLFRYQNKLDKTTEEFY
jgi:cob(I)alamin adenosyltransferase